MDSDLQTVLDDHFLDGHRTLDVDGLRALRTRCRRLETVVSYLRRLAQARIDIVSAELERRADGGDPTRVAELVQRLPTVLAETPDPGRGGPLPDTLDPESVHGALADELAAMELNAHLDRLEVVSAEWLVRTRDALGDYERRVSDIRRRLFDRIDTLGQELGRRYRTGEADITSAIIHG